MNPRVRSRCPHRPSRPPSKRRGTADEHIVLPDASRQQPGEGVAGQPSPPAEQPTYVEPERIDPASPASSRPSAGPRYIEETGDEVEGDDSTGVVDAHRLVLRDR